MRILVTNDDGISAPGLEVAEAIAAELAGPDGEVWVVAPAFEQSGVAHSVSYVRPMRLERLETAPLRRRGLAGRLRARAACTRSSRTARPTWCSPASTAATTSPRTRSTPAPSAARWRRRCTACARSRCRSTSGRWPAARDPFAAARAHGAACCAGCSTPPPGRATPYAVFYNVNFPPVPAADGARHCAPPSRATAPAATFGVLPHVAPNGRTFLWLTHGHGNADTPPGSDSRECHDGHITVTPLDGRPDRARPHRAACAGARLGRGSGMHPAEQQMQFVFTLRSRGVTNAEVLKAMEATPRDDFLEGIFQERAFEDTPLPIACGQTISQPTVVGLMTQALEVDQPLQGARDRHRLGLPGGDPRAARAAGLHRRAPPPAGAAHPRALPAARAAQHHRGARRRLARPARAGAVRPHHRHRRRRGPAAGADRPAPRGRDHGAAGRPERTRCRR